MYLVCLVRENTKIQIRMIGFKFKKGREPIALMSRVNPQHQSIEVPTYSLKYKFLTRLQLKIRQVNSTQKP